MRKPGPPLFLERQSYRRRRLADGARFLPVAGFVLILLPALWTGGDGPGAAAGAGTAQEVVYLFALWSALIAVAALIARPLRAMQDRDDRADRADRDTPARVAGAEDMHGSDRSPDPGTDPEPARGRGAAGGERGG